MEVKGVIRPWVMDRVLRATLNRCAGVGRAWERSRNWWVKIRVIVTWVVGVFSEARARIVHRIHQDASS